jgi:hypothetical protein
MAWLIILAIIFATISGIAKAICDLSEEDRIKFKPKTFWIKSISWKNKWKDGDKSQGEKFWGSSRWFVSFTDAWHLFGLVERISLATAFTLIGLLIAKNIWFIFLTLGCYIIFALSFHVFYTYIFRKK